MKVKVGSAVYNSDDQPIMVILSPGEKQQIAESGDSTKYCVYPSLPIWTDENYKGIKEWMARDKNEK